MPLVDYHNPTSVQECLATDTPRRICTRALDRATTDHRLYLFPLDHRPRDVRQSFPLIHAHRQTQTNGSHETLIHSPYLDTLPSPTHLRTPLHFTKEETDALRGTNVYGATLD